MLDLGTILALPCVHHGQTVMLYIWHVNLENLIKVMVIWMWVDLFLNLMAYHGQSTWVLKITPGWKKQDGIYGAIPIKMETDGKRYDIAIRGITLLASTMNYSLLTVCQPWILSQMTKII